MNPRTTKRRLGVNIDHIATLRQLRLGRVPELRRALPILRRAGADSLTAHLRGDRRHIQDGDVEMFMAESPLPLNLELSMEMVGIALKLKPHSVCLVPENRSELTTEGGLDVRGLKSALSGVIGSLRRAGCGVSLFVDPQPRQIEAAIALKPQAVELHTGAWCNAREGGGGGKPLYAALADSAKRLKRAGVGCHAGHGLNYETTALLAKITEIEEFNIGHFLVAEAVFLGLEAAVTKMRGIIDDCGG